MAGDGSRSARTPWRGAILAGGQASRLGGREKSALVVGGATIMMRQLDAFEAAGLDPLVVADHPDRFPEMRWRVLVDRWPGAGPLGGLATALAGANADALVVVACDLPFVNPGFFRLLQAYLASHDAAVPHDGTRWHPLAAAYSVRCLPHLERALENGARAIWRTLGTLDVAAVDAGGLAAVDPDGRLLTNINTPQDVEQIQL